jgi:hypothetical protein
LCVPFTQISIPSKQIGLAITELYTAMSSNLYPRVCMALHPSNFACPRQPATLVFPGPLNISASSRLQKFLSVIVCCATEEGSPVIIFARSRVEEEVTSDQLKHHACQRPHVCWGGVLSAQEHLTSAQQSFLQVLTHQYKISEYWETHGEVSVQKK